MCRRLWGFIDAVFLGELGTCIRANRLLRSKMKDCDLAEFLESPCLHLPLESLKSFHSVSIERIMRIEGKAMGTLIGVGVAIPVLSSVSGIVGRDGILAHTKPALMVSAAALLMVAILSFLGSGWLALHSYRIGEVYRPNMDDYDTGADPRQLARVLVYSTKQNDRIASIRSNWLTAAFNQLRNGLVAIAALAILIIISSVA